MSTVTVQRGTLLDHLHTDAPVNLLTLLRQHGIPLAAACGGTGKCGKCRVVLDGQSVLACRTEVKNDCTVILPEETDEVLLAADGIAVTVDRRPGIGAAVDLGTTTVAVRLFDLATGKLLYSAGQRSAQCAYGADVVTRMQVAMEQPDGTEVLAKAAQDQLRALLGDRPVTRVTVAGNTVMQHLLAGLSPVGMATAPFTPVTLFDAAPCSLPELPPVQFAPCLSAYVGGDILAGLYASGAGDEEKPVLYLDIGTNGEMALGDRHGFVCCAVACGPAFEGAEITCGMNCTTGAVSHVKQNGNTLACEVSGGGTMRGICGSGLIDLLAALRTVGIVDEGGRLLPPEECDGVFPFLEEDENGNGLCRLSQEVYLTAGDVRKLQLAKAAVAAGIEILLKEQGLAESDVAAVYLAGGFGSRIDPLSAALIGMLPNTLVARTRSVGNASLAGASAMLLDPHTAEKLEQLRAKCRYRELSGDGAFAQAFMEHMVFEEE
jgi:uncharacterized 2Fe-2S/4Fe-4S cluster protein (DUF4445 family)